MIMSNLNINNFFILILFFNMFSYGQKTESEPMNIVWISCEDMGPILSSYGNTSINTPNIDRLAKEGVKYTNAYSTVGVCAPSRFSIITGMYPVRLGAHNMRTGDHNNFKWPEDVKFRNDKGVNDKTGANIPYSLVILITPIFNTTEKVDQGPDRITQKQILKFRVEIDRP